ncbi:MAG: spore coat protein U domain-containing protein, partial [Candidatus Velthaea sp.]
MPVFRKDSGSPRDARPPRYAHVRAVSACACAVLVLLSRAAADAAGLCTIATATINFGSYNVFNPTSTMATGSLTVNCTVASSFSVALSQGNSGTFATRTMRNGGFALNYNLYIDAAQTIVWGDGTS